MNKTGTLDATKHSTTNTPLREASELWQAFIADGRARLALSQAQFAPADSRLTVADAVKVANEAAHIASIVIDLLEKIRWPTMDQATCRPSDERAFEQASRHLQTPGAGIDLAWGLVFQALRQSREWRDNPHYSQMGVDLSAYFAAEADATLQVIMRDHLRLANAGKETP